MYSYDAVGRIRTRYQMDITECFPANSPFLRKKNEIKNFPSAKRSFWIIGCAYDLQYRFWNSKDEKWDESQLIEMMWISHERNKLGNYTVEWRKTRFHPEQKRFQNRKQRIPCTRKNADWRKKIPMQYSMCGNRFKTKRQVKILFSCTHPLFLRVKF